MNKKILLWMNCYGSWAPEYRHPIETIGYNQYLNGVIKSVKALEGRIEAMFISGGMTDSKGKTECETTKPELEKRLSKNKMNISIRIDEESLTSISIMKKFLTTWTENYSDCFPIIFVDQVRYETNRYTFNEYCKVLKINLKPEEVIVPLPRLDTHINSTVEKQNEKLQIMKEKGIDYVEQIELDKRKKSNTISG